MKILIVDDGRTNRMALKSILDKDSHSSVLAEDGQHALNMLEMVSPDLVLMDTSMPVMDGYQACRRIKIFYGEKFVPVIFMVDIENSEVLSKCVDSGGDEFIARPFNADVIRAKIKAMDRIRRLHSNLHEHKLHIDNDLRVASHVYKNVVVRQMPDVTPIRSWISPLSSMSGDVLLCAPTPAGGWHIMLGDMAGHGVSAAIGMMPVSEVFYTMSSSGFSIGDIADEINNKILRHFPRDMFCAAGLIEVTPDANTVLIWNGGLPDMIVYDSDGRVRHRIKSSHQPLGVIDGVAFSRKCEILTVHSDDRIFVSSYGFVDLITKHHNNNGINNIEAFFMGAIPPNNIFDEIITEAEKLIDRHGQEDDISLIDVKLKMTKQLAYDASNRGNDHRVIHPSGWQLSVNMEADTLRAINPIPHISNMIMEIQAPYGHRERIFTLISELFTNSLDHGLLKLDSEIKKTAEGFTIYYQLRHARLNALDSGFISVNISHFANRDEGVLCLELNDSGDGFDHDGEIKCIDGNERPSGRGISLVRNLCDELTYSNNGASVRAVYRWS